MPPQLSRALGDCRHRCRQLGVRPTRFILLAGVAMQQLWALENMRKVEMFGRGSARFKAGRGLFGLPSIGAPVSAPGAWESIGQNTPRRRSAFRRLKESRHGFRGMDWRLVRTCRCSTSRFGIGQIEGSNHTPLGLHRIAQKIGGGWPVGTVFKHRRPIGFTWQGLPDAKITTRILWLDGLEPGFNRGGEVDSYRRYLYLHGTGDETSLGRPASCGCVHLAANDLILLFDQLPVGTLVWITG